MRKKRTNDISYAFKRHILPSIFTDKMKPGEGRFDKLSFTVARINKKHYQKFYQAEFKGPSSVYKESYSVTDRNTGTRFMLFKSPRFKNVNHLYKIELNPRSFRSFDELRIFCRRLIKGYDIKGSHRILRVDCAVTLPNQPLNPELFFRSTYVKWKRVSTRFHNASVEESGGKVSGFSIGTIRSSRLSVYEFKKCHEDKMEKELRESIQLRTGKRIPRKFTKYTRLEIQLSASKTKKLGIARIEDLGKLMDATPFKHLGSIDAVSKFKGGSLSDKKKYRKLQLENRIHGAHGAKASLNYDGNFRRDYLHLVRPLKIGRDQVPLFKFIKRSFRNGLRRWFKGTPQARKHMV